MSIQAIDESGWETSSARAALRRIVLLLVFVTVVVGPFVVGGTVAWIVTREAGPVLGDDGWLRSRTSLASNGSGYPLVSAGELSAAGLSVDDARKVLRR